jgi:hypothetical protein
MTTAPTFGSADFAAAPCQTARTGQKDGMDFDDQLLRYFGTADLAAIHPEAHAAGTSGTTNMRRWSISCCRWWMTATQRQ